MKSLCRVYAIYSNFVKKAHTHTQSCCQNKRVSYEIVTTLIVLN